MQSSLRFFLLFTTILVNLCSRLHAAEASREPKTLSNKDLSTIASFADTNHLKKSIDNILIPRVVGTENHEKVFRYIVKELTNLGMDVKVDEFVEDTPIFGPLTFKNIIATSNPHAEKFLVLSCHYDSKFFENFVFEAAIDSAVPCAMIVNIAKILSNDKFKTSNKTDASLKLIFFDGEEAFDTWGPHDSIYGAKHLARKLETNVTRLRSTGQDVSEIQQIELLILLDLIGARNPSFHSFFRNTEKWFLRMAEIETQLRRSNLLENHHQSYFKKSRPHGQIEDDHIPFLIRGVPILHLITVPFPPEWHTIDDNRQIIDMSTVKNINLILTAFVVDYLRLSLSADSNGSIPEKEL